MLRRTHLRTRVLLMTGAFAVALFSITFGLSWRAKRSQERWSHLIGVETEAIAALEEIVRAQNSFYAQTVMPHEAAGAGGGAIGPAQFSDALVRRYRVVAQLLQTPALESIDITPLRGRVRAFATILADPHPRTEDLTATSTMVVREAQRIIDERKAEVGHTLPELEHDTRSMMESGLAVAWIIVVVSFAMVQAALRKVVRPLEELSASADRIAGGDLTARARVAGDHEIARLATALNGMADELRARARTDELTHLPNFRAFREQIEGEIERAGRYPSSFGVLVLDLDHFKKYNDTYGHLAGNDALRRVSETIRETVRVVDFAARYGGEEFAVIAPEVDVPALTVIAERVRASIEALPAPPDGTRLTVSIGAALFPLDGADPEALFHAADERLYAAKHAGRNRVVVPVAERAAAPGTQAAGIGSTV
jgi:diguanylate cyclase (GGDEF)-like protein